MVSCQVCGKENKNNEICFNCGSQIKIVEPEEQEFPFEQPITDDRISSSKFQRHKYEPTLLYNFTVLATLVNPLALILLQIDLEWSLFQTTYLILAIIQLPLIAGFFLAKSTLLRWVRNIQIIYSIILMVIGGIHLYLDGFESDTTFSGILTQLILIIVNMLVIHVIFFKYDTKMIFEE